MFRRSRPQPTPLPVWAELRDVTRPSEARRVGAEFAREPHFATDLLRVRPWLAADLPARDVPAALLDSEWSGIMALLADPGPWVYAKNVRDLQDLSHLYVRLFQAVGEVSAPLAGDSLCARLGAVPTPELAALEAAYWQKASDLARTHHAEWQRQKRNR